MAGAAEYERIAAAVEMACTTGLVALKQDVDAAVHYAGKRLQRSLATMLRKTTKVRASST